MITQKLSYLSDLHFDHKQWKNELSFWKDEIKLFENQLSEIVQKLTNKDALSRVEHFQNVFVLQLEKIDIIRHNINLHEQRLAKIAEDHPEEVNKKHFHDHNVLRDDLIIQRKLFREMKEDFFHFLSKYL